VGQFFFIIQGAICEERNTVGGYKEAGSVLVNLLVGFLGNPGDHAVRKPSASALVNKKA
jgi:hypothetical protein